MDHGADDPPPVHPGVLAEVLVLGRDDRDAELLGHGREGERPAANLPELRDQALVAGVYPQGHLERHVAQRIGGRKLGNEVNPDDEGGGEDGD